MADDYTLRDLLTPVCPLGTADSLILEWVQDGTLFRVKQVPGYFLDIAPMLVNYRLCTTWIDDQSRYDRFWCYAGSGRATWMAAVLAATMWDGSDETEPMGWNKNGQSSEFREPEHPQVWQNSRAVKVYLDEMKGWPRRE
jgi:hypothetical protein